MTDRRCGRARPRALLRAGRGCRLLGSTWQNHLSYVSPGAIQPSKSFSPRSSRSAQNQLIWLCVLGGRCGERLLDRGSDWARAAGVYAVVVVRGRSTDLTWSMIFFAPRSRSSIEAAYEMRRKPGRVEGLAWRHRDARPVEQRLRELRRGAQAVRRQEIGDVRKQVERAGRLHQAEPRLLGQPDAQLVAARRGTRRACRSRSSCGPVSAATTAFCVIEQTFDVEWLCSALHAATTCAGAERPAAAPAGHRVGLRRRSAEHRAIAHASGPARRAGCAASDRRSASRSRGRAGSRCRASPPPARRSSRSSSDISAPVGLPGELMMMPRVFGVNASRNVSARSRKPSSACVWTMTGVASASLICSTSVGQPGVCVMTSSPAPNSAIAALKSACLPPAVTMTSLVAYSTP